MIDYIKFDKSFGKFQYLNWHGLTETVSKFRAETDKLDSSIQNSAETVSYVNKMWNIFVPIIEPNQYCKAGGLSESDSCICE